MWSGFGQNSQGSENEDSPAYHDCGSGLPTGSSFQKEVSRQATQQMFLRGKSFQSASTMGSSSSDRKSENQINLLRSTKQFKAELSLSESRVSLPMRKRTIWPTSTFTLECQPEGGTVDFDLYDECDLPFLDKSTEVGRMVSQNII